uniref:KAP family P-loop NTPase fold protein n=1 Tax=Bifidobacterium adolescentis TaxID=1680 RepID=UPI003FEE13BF
MNSTFSFQDDSPLSKQKAGNKTVSSLDRFGRTTLIRNLAQAISASVSKNGSLVVSLEGPWGSGKTSAKNMLKESLTECWVNKRKHSNNYPRLINAEFDPWLFSESNDVVSLMFSSIINAIDVYLPEELEKRTSFSRKIEAAGKALGTASHIDPSGILKSASDALQWVSENLNPTDNNVKPLIQARNELIRQLRSFPEDYAIVVYIDEIDRLDDKDIATLFKALKSVGNLPHVIYVPVFDREIVTAALDRVTQQGRGNQYLEKIIQIPIVLPKIPMEVVWEDFIKEISVFTSSNNSAVEQNHLAHNIFELKNDIFAKLEHHLMVLKKYDIAPIKCDNNTALRESHLGQESKLIGYIAKNKYILEEDIKENRQMLKDSLMNKVSDMADFIITEKD